MIALVVTIITEAACVEFAPWNEALQRVINDHQHLPVKTAAIHALAVVTFFTDVSTEGVESVLDYYHEIIENDGHTIGAGDDPGVVTAAIEEWGFLVTLLDDAEDVTESSMPAFVDQLDSTEISVQVAAGEVIALLFETGHRPYD